jgi:orotate phosphoribosyltransferase
MVNDISDQTIKLLKKTKAILTNGHFVGTSGRHMGTYINKDALYPHTDETSRMGELFAIKNKEYDIDVVAAPAVGGTILSQWTAYHLSKLKDKEILSIYTEKDKGTTASASESEQIFRRGYDTYVKGQNILVIEDLTTTGLSVKKLVQVVKQTGGNVVAVCVMVNRDPKLANSKSVGAPFSSLAVLEVPSWEPNDCPLCKQNMPINTGVGHGKKFLKTKVKQK